MKDSPFKEDEALKTTLRSADTSEQSAEGTDKVTLKTESSLAETSDTDSAPGQAEEDNDPGSKIAEAEQADKTKIVKNASINDSSQKSTATNLDSDELPDLGERFEVLQRIGRGGMGSVYKVRDKNIDAILAVKVLQQNLIQDQAALKRFEQEADAARKLSHPNLVSVYDHGTTIDGAPYLVMDYLEGRGLADILNDSQTLDSRRAIKIFKDICEALSYAHKEGVIHRDIKPTNIIITNVGQPAEQAHIVDFGIAKVLPTANRETHDLTQTGEIFGSPHYMSPEQCLGFMLDNRSDIYSLGCLMYEALTGGAPFEGANPIQVVVKHINEEPAEFSRAVKVDKLVEKLESVVMRCLDKEKTERYQNVDDVIKDLISIETGKPVVKYARTARAKPMFTKRQTLGFLVVFVGLTIYGTIVAMTFHSEIGGRVLGGLITLVCLAGVYVFYSAALDIFKKRIKVLTESNAWLILLLASLGTGSLTAIQYPAILVLGYSHLPHQDVFRQIFLMNSLVHILALVSCVIAGLGCLFFRSPKKFNPLTLSAKYVVVGVVSALFCQFVIPTETAKGLSLLGSAATRDQPLMAKYLLETAFALDKKQEHVYEIATINHTLGNHDAELKAYVELLQDPTQGYRFPDLATKFKEHGNPDRALQFMSQAIQYAVERKDKFSESRDLAIRASYYREKKDFLSAQKDYQAALAADPHNQDVNRSLLQIDCALGQYREAAALTEKLLNMSYASNSYLVYDHTLAGILYDALGETALANSHYKTVVDRFRADGSSNFTVPTEYAIQRLGLPFSSTYDHQPLKPHEKNSLITLLGVADSHVPIKWATKPAP